MKKKFIKTLLASIVLLLCYGLQAKTPLWSIGTKNSNGNEFALAPNDYKNFIKNDFGYEDHAFIVGYSDPKEDFPYVLPGPVDTWGGTWPTSGWRTHEANIYFSLKNKPSANDHYTLIVDLADFAKQFLPLVKISINEIDAKYQLETAEFKISNQKKATQNEPERDTLSIRGNFCQATPTTLTLSIKGEDLKLHGNNVKITVLEGSWILFDRITLEGPTSKVNDINKKIYIKDIQVAEYELEENGKRYQPLLIDLLHLSDLPQIVVTVDNELILNKTIEKGRYILEALMPSVSKKTTSKYTVSVDGDVVASGKIIREQKKIQTLADYVDTRIGTGHSRWMIAPGPWMPFSMVKMSPDNQNKGWQAGYQPSFETIGCFSHIHEWTLGGLGIMATNGDLKIDVGDEQKPDEGYRSRINKRTERADIGIYKAHLIDYNIQAEVSATTRCGIAKFTFPQNKTNNRILIELHPQAEYDFFIKEININKISDYRIEGFIHQFSPGVWSHDADQDYKLHFVIEFSQPMKDLGHWCDGEISSNTTLFKHGECREAGLFAQFDTSVDPVVITRSSISLVSVKNAIENLTKEVIEPYNWDFEAIVQNQVNVWNDLFSRLKIQTDDRLEKTKFYNNMFRSICSRNIWSDVNGEWISTDGEIRRVDNPEKDVMLGCDAFWNTFWNLNQFWNLVTPEWSSKWVNSQLNMYKANGWLAKGPAGLNYIPVMVAEHEIPLIVSAWQMGIRDFDKDLALEACIKMQSTPAKKIYKGFAGNRDLESYLKYNYVPYDKGRFSNTMEYSYDDWTIGQFAKSIGNDEIYSKFNTRGYWWKNVISKEGYCHMKDSKGKWLENFDPFRSGANHHYVEGNAWQLTFFVPQDVPALVEKIGRKRFIDRLLWGFNQDEPYRYNAPNDQYWDHPIVQGNQQSMHFAYLFNWAGQPWNTQKWSRSILDRYYGYGVSNAYLGDEDQGQMSAWAVMTAIGLFQTDGGCKHIPIYEIGSPSFEKVTIDLGNRYGRGKSFQIIAKGASRNNIYVQKATLNGRNLNSFYFPASELLKGGTLILEMGSSPNKEWGVENY